MRRLPVAGRTAGLAMTLATTLATTVVLAGCGSSGPSGKTPAAWAEDVCPSFITYGEGQVNANNAMNNATAAVNTDLAQAKVALAATAFGTISSDITELRKKLADTGTPAVKDGKTVIHNLDQGLADYATTIASVTAGVRALKGHGQPLADQIGGLQDKFTNANQTLSGVVASGFSTTDGGKVLEQAFTNSSCAKKLASEQASAAP